MKNILYQIKRKYKQVRNIIKWIPVLWNQFDFDYSYALDVFKVKLLEIVDRMESDRATCVGAKDRAKRIRMVVRLMEKVYNDDYGMEYLDQLDKLYGKELMEYVDIPFIRDGRQMYSYKQKYQLTETPERIKEIEEMTKLLCKRSHEKQERAHKLLWKLVEHNIRGWWD